MGLFSGLNGAKIGAGGVYFSPNHQYLVDIVKVTTLTSRKREDLFIVEGLIVESTDPERKPGTKASQVINFKHDAAHGNIRMFLAAANGIDPADERTVEAEITEEVAEYAASNENPLAGVRVRLATTGIKTREGNPFTLHNWTPFAGGLPATKAG